MLSYILDSLNVGNHEDLPLAAMDTLYAYNGSGMIPQGYGDPYQFAKKLSHATQQSGSNHVTLKTFAATVSQGASILKGENTIYR